MLAVALRKLCGDRIRVDIYEAAHAFSEIGAGIGVWPRVWATMEALDLAGDLSAIATGNDGMNCAILIPTRTKRLHQVKNFRYEGLITPRMARHP